MMEKNNVFLLKPSGGFYIYIDFKNYKDKLMRIGVGNSGELVERILEKTGVVLLPSKDFGRDD
jgi:aspartate aminotransferase